MRSIEKKQVIKAIGDLGRRVTPADVATKTGLPILVVQQKLNEVASETGGHLQVGTTGDVAYAFAPGFSNAYIARGILAAWSQVWEKLSKVLMYVVRISFGIMLIVSLVIFVIMILVIVAIMMRGTGTRDRDDDRGGSGFTNFPIRIGYWDWMILRDLFLWNAYSYRPYKLSYDQPTVRRRAKSNFLLNCFSFLFGDGDPNEGLEEKQWQLIAQVIKRHNNVLTAEQLAPYTGADPKNEDAVLPVLVRFNGRPEVTESGNIIYIFESMQTVAAEQWVDPPSYLKEFPQKFSEAPMPDLLPVTVIAVLNFTLGWGLWLFLYGKRLADGDISMLSMSPLNILVLYGTLFLLVPAVRAMYLKAKNKAIEERNIRRFRFAQIVGNPSEELGLKLKEAVSLRVKDRKLNQSDIVYTTEKASLDQKDDLDREFEEREKSLENAGPAEQKDTVEDFTPEPNLDVRAKLEQDFDASP